MPAFSRFLRYFMVVGRLGSIRKAAETLNVSGSAIDRQILRAEEELGIPLFERLPTGLRLTAAGEIMMAAGGRWQKNFTEIRAQMEDLRGLRRGHVEIAVIDALAKGYIPRVLEAIHAKYPGITVGIRVMDNDHVRLAIASGEVDCGIFFEPQSYRDLTVRASVEVVLGFVTPAGHPLAEMSQARFSACAGMKLIVPAEPLALYQQVSVLEGATRAIMDAAVTCDNVQMIASLVSQGLGLGILTWLDVMTEVRAGTLAFVRISDPLLRPMTLALCTSSARMPSHAAGIVLTEIENTFGELTLPGTNDRAEAGEVKHSHHPAEAAAQA